MRKYLFKMVKKNLNNVIQKLIATQLGAKMETKKLLYSKKS